MGFTKTHVVGVFVTESLLVAVGIALTVSAFLVEEPLRVPLLHSGVVSELVAISVILASILSLLFFRGCDVPKDTDAPVDD